MARPGVCRTAEAASRLANPKGVHRHDAGIRPGQNLTAASKLGHGKGLGEAYRAADSNPSIQS